MYSLAQQCNGTVLDIGCGRQNIRANLQHTHYIGLDNYHTATEWYGTKPDVFARGEALPVADACINHVLLLDVLEHIPDPEAALLEVCRVLKPGGTAFLQVPFLYPLHDRPLDFQRWTEYGLLRLLQRAGLTLRETVAVGKPAETAEMLFNLGLCKNVLDAVGRRHPAALLVILLPLMIPVVNLCSWLIARLLPDDGYMPGRYHLIAVKQPG